jgi:hypothetical protein
VHELLKLVLERIHPRRTVNYRHARCFQQPGTVAAHPSLEASMGGTVDGYPDVLMWRWTADGVYMSASCYKAMFMGFIESAS